MLDEVELQAVLAHQAVLLQWYQRSELSADRAALLVTDDVAVVQRALSKLTGFSPRYCDSLNLDRLKQQAVQFEEIGTGSVVEKALKVWTLLQLTHPVPVLRIHEIGRWAQSEEPHRVANALRGDATVVAARNCSWCGAGDESGVSPFCWYCGLNQDSGTAA